MSRTTIEIDGSQGEGGGQVLRSSLALSIALRQPVSLTKIRAKRSKPGLQPQHLASVRFAQALCHASVDGARKGSTALRFEPGDVVSGKHVIDIGTAGAATLVAHTVIPALVAARAPATLVITGGTHVPMSPPFEHLALAYAPALAHVGARVLARIERHGFYPSGGGRIVVDVDFAPAPATTSPLEIPERGALRDVKLVTILGNGVPEHVAARERDVVTGAIHELAGGAGGDGGAGGPGGAFEIVRPPVPGNALALVIESEHVVDVVSAVGARGVRAEQVAGDVVSEARAYLDAAVPIGAHLADQLLLPMALARGGSFVTVAPVTLHTRTHADVIRAFLGDAVDITFTEIGHGAVRVHVARR